MAQWLTSNELSLLGDKLTQYQILMTVWHSRLVQTNTFALCFSNWQIKAPVKPGLEARSLTSRVSRTASQLTQASVNAEGWAVLILIDRTPCS